MGEPLLTGWIREHRLEEAAPGVLASALARARIPKRFWSADPLAVKGDTRWVQKALAKPEKWAGEGYGFFIHGAFNTGKSAAAAIFARDFVMRCHVVVWVAVRDVPAIRFHEGEMAAVDAMLKRADLLVLDDLGSERFRLESAAGAALEEVVRIMYESRRPTIITSNKSWEEFRATYSTAFVSLVRRVSVPVALTDPWDEGPTLSGVRS